MEDLIKVEDIIKMCRAITLSKKVGQSYKETVEGIRTYAERNGFLSAAQIKFVKKQYYRATDPQVSQIYGGYSERSGGGGYYGRVGSANKISYMGSLDKDEMAEYFGMYQY